MGISVRIYSMPKAGSEPDEYEDAFAFDRRLLGGVERGGVVFEILNQCSRLRPLIEDFGLAFVNHAAALHGKMSYANAAGIGRSKRETGTRSFRVPVAGQLSGWGRPVAMFRTCVLPARRRGRAVALQLSVGRPESVNLS